MHNPFEEMPRQQQPPAPSFFRQQGQANSKFSIKSEGLSQSRIFPVVIDEQGNFLQLRTGNGFLIARTINADGTLKDEYRLRTYDSENKRWRPIGQQDTEVQLKAVLQNNFENFGDKEFKVWQSHWIEPKKITEAARKIAGIDEANLPDTSFFISPRQGIQLPVKSSSDVFDKDTVSLLEQLGFVNGASKKLAGKLLNQNLASIPADKDDIATQIRDAGAGKNKKFFTVLFSEHENLQNYFLDLLGREIYKEFAIILDEKGQIPRAAQFAAIKMTREPTEANIKAFLQFTTSKDIKLPDDLITQIQQAVAQDKQTLRQTVLDKFAGIGATTLSDSKIQQEIEKAKSFFEKSSQQVDEFAQTYCKKDWVTQNELLNLQRKRIVLLQIQTEIKKIIRQLAAIRRKKLDNGKNVDDLETQIFNLDTLTHKIDETLALSHDIKSDQTRFTIFTQDNNTKKYHTSEVSNIESLLKHPGVQLDPETTAQTTINYKKHPKKDEVNGTLMIDNTHPEKMRESMRQTIKHFVGNVGAHKDFHLRHDDPQLIACAFVELINAGIETRNIHLPPNIVKNFLTETILLLPKEIILKFTPDEIKEWPATLRHIIETKLPDFNNFSSEQQAAIKGQSFFQSPSFTVRSR